MKKSFVLSLIALVFSSFTSVEKVNWYSWDKGYELAKKEKKPILMFVQATWCDMCKRMDTKTFTNEEVVAIINKNYIPIKLDIDVVMKGKDVFKKDGKEISGKELLLSFVPPGPLGIPLNIIIVTDSEKNEMISGLKDPIEMKEILLTNCNKQAE